MVLDSLCARRRWVRGECQVNKSIRLNQYETFSLFIKSSFHHYFSKLEFSVEMNLLRKQTDAVFHLFLIKSIVTLRLYYTKLKWVWHGYCVSYRASFVDAMNVLFVVRYTRCYPIWGLRHSMRSEPVGVCNVWWDYAIWIWQLRFIECGFMKLIGWSMACQATECFYLFGRVTPARNQIGNDTMIVMFDWGCFVSAMTAVILYEHMVFDCN